MNYLQTAIKQISRPFGAVLDRIQRRFRRSRAGSVMIMVVALLVLLALMGTAYVTTARLDRLGSAPLTFQATLDDTLTELLQTQVDALQQRIMADKEYQTGGSASLPPPVIPPANPPVLVVPPPGAPSPEALRYLASRTPQFFPIYYAFDYAPVSGTDGYLNQTIAGSGSTIATNPQNKLFIVGPTVPQLPVAHQVAWRSISRPPSGTRFDTPYTPYTLPPYPLKYPITQWSADDDVNFQHDYWMVPTNIVVQYPNRDPAIVSSEDLVGRTRVFPAFNRYRYERFGPNTSLYIDPKGPYLAADASGSGVADAGLIQINSTPLNGLTFYYAVRVVDNSSGLNINAHWSPTSDVGPSVATATVVDSNNFHPGAVDLDGLLQRGRGLQEMGPNPPIPPNPPNLPTVNPSVQKEWFNQFSDAPIQPLQPYQDAVAGPPPYAPVIGLPRTDFTFRTRAEALWSQYTSRLAFTGAYNNLRRFGLNTPIGTRAFGPEDQAALSYRGGTVFNPDLTRSHVEDTFFNSLNLPPPPPNLPFIPDSLYGSAMNFVDNSSDNFRFVSARDVHYWFDYNYNWEGIVDPNPAWANTLPPPFGTPGPNYGGIGNKLGFTAAASPPLSPAVGARFRTARPLIDAYGPIANRANITAADIVDLFAAMPWLKEKVGPPGPIPKFDWMEPFAGTAVPKVSLNTAQFPALFRGYFAAMIDNNALPAKSLVLPKEPFKVPNTAPGIVGPLSESKGTFRNSIRGNSGAGDSTQSNTWGVRFDKYNQLLLRSAIAAVNTIDIRDSDGMVGVNKVGDVTSKKIQLKTVTGEDVEVTVYGTEAHPFITEIFANTDTVTKEMVTMKNNPKGFVAIELFNPYPFDLDISKYKLAMLDRRSPGDGGTMTLNEIKTRLVGTVPAKGFLVLHNFGAGGANDANYIPGYVNGGLLPVGGAVKDLHYVFEDSLAVDGALKHGGELILMRPHHHLGIPATARDNSWNEANISDWVPVDSYDFTGLSVDTATNNVAVNWHYKRIADSLPASAWKCVYPGKYTLAATKSPITPRQEGTNFSTTWDPNAMETDPWTGVGDVKNAINLTQVKTQASYRNLFPGIQLNNFNWGTKPPLVGGNRFPFGGFSRVGEVMQVPFIGSYRIRKMTGNAPIPPASPMVELTPVTMDSMFVDDVDPTDDAVEQLGRFCPIRLPKVALGTSIDDLNPFGTYDRLLAPIPMTNQTVPLWKYRWTTKIFDEFTVIANPNDDYLPNTDPGVDPTDPTTPTQVRKYPGLIPPSPVPNSKAAAAAALTLGINNGNEDSAPIEGLININTAPWRVLAAMQMIPNSQGGNAIYPTSRTTFPNPQNLTYNEMLAKLIVYFRDVDDGMLHDDLGNPRPHPHGPFQSLAELNAVFDPASYNAGNGAYDFTFQNALGKLTGAATVDATWGNFASGSAPPTTTPPTVPNPNHMAQNDFELNYLMINRISNLVTTRSDTFTAYVMIQGWRNVNTETPELVVQKRAAFILDRSASNPSTPSFKTFSVETR